MKPIKLAIVGLGRAGKGMHLAELAGKDSMFEIYAVCDIIEERRKEVSEKYNCKAYASIEEVIADPEVEIVDIATRSCDHFTHAMMALKAGKNVFLEKPICCNYADAKALMDYADAHPEVKLYIRHNRRWEKMFEKGMELADSGLLGNVAEVRLARNGFTGRSDWQTIDKFGGGQLLNWGPHIIDHALNFCGGDYTDIYAETRQTLASGNCEDHIKLVMTGINGRIVDMEISSCVATFVPQLMIYGDRGAAWHDPVTKIFTWKYLKPGFEFVKPPANEGTPEGWGTAQKLEWVEGEMTPEERREPLDETWVSMYENFREGKPYRITHAEALKVVEVISKIKEIMAEKTK